MTARVAPAEAPYDGVVQKAFDRLMPDGVDPLILFRTLARDERLFQRFMGAGLLDKGHLSLREREIAIDRTCGLCRSEYEWGVHVAMFAERVGLTPAQVAASVTGDGDNEAWAPRDRLIVQMMEALHATSTINDDLWAALRGEFDEMALIELIMLAGFYHTVSYLTNALNLPLEPYGARFP